MEIIMLTRSSLLCLSLTISLPLAAQPYVEIDSFFSSDPIALDAISNDWEGEYHPNGEKQTASIWLESGFRKNDWSFGALYREEHQLSFSSDTADLYYTVANNQELNQDRPYNIDLDAYRFRGFGARLAKQFQANNKLKFSLGTSLFSASNLLDGRLSGSATANAAENYQYQFDVDYSYSEDLLFNRPSTDTPTGIGLALDLDLQWTPNQQTQISLKVKDLAGAIRWKDVPFTEAQADSNTATVNADGFSSVNPILSGFEGDHSSYTQRLKPSADLMAKYQLQNSSYTTSAKIKHINGFNLFALGGSRDIMGSTLSLHYWPQVDTLETGYQGKHLGFSFGIDNLDLSDAQTLWLTLKYQ